MDIFPQTSWEYSFLSTAHVKASSNLRVFREVKIKQTIEFDISSKLSDLSHSGRKFQRRGRNSSQGWCPIQFLFISDYVARLKHFAWLSCGYGFPGKEFVHIVKSGFVGVRHDTSRYGDSPRLWSGPCPCAFAHRKSRGIRAPRLDRLLSSWRRMACSRPLPFDAAGTSC